ncbi:hypothetical protein AB0D67_13675 [Streptosporangium sp. NPDC048047]|uniref:hypothetical protein n=1 Tax=Streptosporangium sp. NPDC048047 TaxID=3155748 RepID=UPI003424C1EC
MVIEVGHETLTPSKTQIATRMAQADRGDSAARLGRGIDALVQQRGGRPRISEVNAGDRLVGRHDRSLHSFPRRDE